MLSCPAEEKSIAEKTWINLTMAKLINKRKWHLE